MTFLSSVSVISLHSSPVQVLLTVLCGEYLSFLKLRAYSIYSDDFLGPAAVSHKSMCSLLFYSTYLLYTRAIA